MATKTFTVSIGVSTTSYAAGDTLGSMTALPTSMTDNLGAGGTLNSVVIVDPDLQSSAMEIWFFASSATAAADNAAHSISDADAQKCMGVVSSGPYYASALNSVSVARGVGLSLQPGSTPHLLLVTRGTPTYAGGSLRVSFTVITD